MKVKFLSDYDTSENLLYRFLENYEVDGELEFTTTNEYDWLIVFNGTKESINYNSKIITVIQEPSFSEVFLQNDFLKNSEYVIIHDQLLFENVWKVKLGKNVLESPSFMFYHDRVNHTFYDEIQDLKKEKKLSMIISSQHFSWGNYIKRLGVLGQILNSDLEIDIYGRGWNIPDDRFKGELESKHTGLAKYEYSIAIENSNEKNYITEKFIDCVLCNTVPIYNGAPNITEVYDDRYFKLIDLNSPHIVDDIKIIISEPAPGTIINKLIYKKTYNLYLKLKEIILNHTRG